LSNTIYTSFARGRFPRRDLRDESQRLPRAGVTPRVTILSRRWYRVSLFLAGRGDGV